MSELADALTHALERAGLRGDVFCHSIARGAWGLRFDADHQAKFHVVTAGTCVLSAAGQHTQLVAGDVVLLPRGMRHALGHSSHGPRLGLQEWLEQGEREGLGRRIGDARSGPATQVLCGVFRFDVPVARHPVLRLIPEVMHVRAGAELEPTLRTLRAEYERRGSGSSLVVTRLLDVLLVQMIRAWVESEPAGGTGWLGALADDTLSHALSLIQHEPAHAWDVSTLARASGTSVSTLNRKFAARIGEPPLAYLTHVRMQEAARLLRSDARLGLAEVAARVGYSSEFAFNRAFKRELGTPPGRYRLACAAL